MSKQIDYSQPVSPEDREWAAQFPALHGGMLEVNAQQYPEEAAVEGSLDGEPDVPPYTEWNVAELTAEAKRRNAEEGTTLKTSGTKAELVAALEADDEARA
jgi:hypothetical protein